MFTSQNLYLYFIASLLLNLTPGNDIIYVASRSISQGVKAGIFSSLGVFLGCMVHITAAILGISLIIAKSAVLFSIVKFAGAAYLVYLGIKALSNKSHFDKKLQLLAGIDRRELLKQGFITNALNPKVAIFFLSFLPQFVNPTSPLLKLQLLTLGLWFAVQGTLILIIVAFLIGSSANYIKRNPVIWAIQEKITGLLLISLGIKVALSSRK